MSKLPYAEVIGDPIAQSKSPLIHGFWLAALGLQGRYDRAHVTSGGLAGYIADRRADPAWRGCNVTMPHKQAVMELVDDPGNIRGTIGAMNTVVHQPDGSLIGTNTDAAGFFAPLAEMELQGAPIVVVGAGGAARAVRFALARAGVGPVTMHAAALDAPLPPAALLVNASSLGMTGQPALDLDLAPLPDGAIVYDLVYSPLRTCLLQAAEARGLDQVDGLDMLIGQAALAFELFFGRSPPEGCDDELRALLTA